MSQLDFQKGKDAEVAWVDALIVQKESQIDAKPLNVDNEPMEGKSVLKYYITLFDDYILFIGVNIVWIISVEDDDTKILTLDPIPSNVDIPPHDTVFLNELKLAEFKQILSKNNISSEISGGILWCANGTVALRRVSIVKYIIIF